MCRYYVMVAYTVRLINANSQSLWILLFEFKTFNFGWSSIKVVLKENKSDYRNKSKITLSNGLFDFVLVMIWSHND